MRVNSRRWIAAAALAIVAPLCLGFNGCVPAYAMAIVMPPDATSVDQFEVFVIDAHGDIIKVAYPEFSAASNVRAFFDSARPAR